MSFPGWDFKRLASDHIIDVYGNTRDLMIADGLDRIRRAAQARFDAARIEDDADKACSAAHVVEEAALALERLTYAIASRQPRHVRRSNKKVRLLLKVAA